MYSVAAHLERVWVFLSDGVIDLLGIPYCDVTDLTVLRLPGIQLLCTAASTVLP